jgi:hypothetical protein
MSNTKELNKKIDALGVRNAKVESDIQAIGLECLEHLEEHGDTMPLNRLINVLRRGQHQAFMMWALAFGKVTKNPTKDTQDAQPVVYAKERLTDIEGATAKPWFEFADAKEDAIKKAFDLQGATMALIRKAAAAGVKHETLVAIGALAGIKPEKVPASVTATVPVEDEAVV